MRNHAFFIALALMVTACSHGQSAATTSTSSTQPDSTVAQNDTATTQSAVAAANSPAPVAGVPTDQGSAPTGSDAAPTSTGGSDSAAPSTTPEIATSAAPSDASTGAQCAFLSNAQVEDAVHLSVRAVQVTSNACEFSFTNQATMVKIEFSTSGGKEEVDSIRKGAGGAQSIVGGIIDAAVGKSGNSSDAQAAKSLAVGTPPPDLPKVGDDQYAFSVGLLTSLVAAKGDEYVTVSITFPPDGVSRWQVLPELASRVLATH
jgi:hypothetical protein